MTVLFFIATVLANLDAAISADFINAVSPLSALCLATWPPPEFLGVKDNCIHLDLDYMKDPMKLINSCLVLCCLSLGIHLAPISLSLPCTYPLILFVPQITLFFHLLQIP